MLTFSLFQIKKIIALVPVLTCIFAEYAHGLALPGGSTEAAQQKWPLLIPLQRESVPVVHKNRTVSYRTSYSGIIALGQPAQEFRVVFDTGSGNIVVPSAGCLNQTCIEHRQYNMSKSQTSIAINVDGSEVGPDELCDQATIMYGTGKIRGEFVREQVCPGTGKTCIEMGVVLAVEMTSHPFRAFTFDGIFGLSLGSLAISSEFSFFNRLGASRPKAASQFGVFLSDEGGGGDSEIAFGGYNSDRVITPLKWAPLVKQELSYWQVSIKEVRIDGEVLEVCKDGTCRGIVDTGTSHLGVPGSEMAQFMEKLSVDTERTPDDCRMTAGAHLEIELTGELTLSLDPENYMRPLSLPVGMSVGTSNGVPILTGTSSSRQKAEHGFDVRTCTPRLMPVNLPQPLGPKLFIIGEPVLHRYYTVYDWKEKQVGFGLSSTAANRQSLQGAGEVDDISFLMQVTLKVTVRARVKVI